VGDIIKIYKNRPQNNFLNNIGQTLQQIHGCTPGSKKQHKRKQYWIQIATNIFFKNVYAFSF
jgi:hypothetical protein